MMSATPDCPDCQTAKATTAGRIVWCWVCEAMEHRDPAGPGPLRSCDYHQPKGA